MLYLILPLVMSTGTNTLRCHGKHLYFILLLESWLLLFYHPGYQSSPHSTSPHRLTGSTDAPEKPAVHVNVFLFSPVLLQSHYSVYRCSIYLAWNLLGLTNLRIAVFLSQSRFISNSPLP